MSKSDCSILFLGKKDDGHTEKAIRFCKQNFTTVLSYVGDWGEPLPKDLQSWDGDYIICYLSKWIIPESLLKKAKKAAINFHPASPDYPGVGCNNFTLYEEAKEGGVTCHHMANKVDTGQIIAVERFPILNTDTVASLLSRVYDYQLVLFYKIIQIILNGNSLPTSKETWSRKPITRKEFNELGKITPEMTKEEAMKRIRATNFGIWKPSVTLHGFVFELKT